MQPKLDPLRFDTMIGLPSKLWGASEIAKALGCSVHTVYRLAEEPDTPVFKPGGRYFAYRHELEAWLKKK